MKSTKVMFMIFLLLLITSSANSAVIHDALQDRIDQLSAGETVKAIAIFEYQPDMFGLNKQLKAEKATLADRNRRSIEMLQEAATLTQPSVVNYLESL